MDVENQPGYPHLFRQFPGSFHQTSGCICNNDMTCPSWMECMIMIFCKILPRGFHRIGDSTASWTKYCQDSHRVPRFSEESDGIGMIIISAQVAINHQPKTRLLSWDNSPNLTMIPVFARILMHVGTFDSCLPKYSQYHSFHPININTQNQL